MKLFLTTIAFLTALAGPVQAAGIIYACKIDDHGRGRGWISPSLALVLPGDGSVQVVDAVTLHFNGGPMPARLLRDNKSRLIVKWTVKNAKADSGRSFANFDYRASVSKGSGKIELSAMPREFDGGLRATGDCETRTE